MLNLSSNQEIFNIVTPYYNEALVSIGFKDHISYMLGTRIGKKNCQNIIWFALLFSLDSKTCVGKIFFSLVDKHFM